MKKKERRTPPYYVALGMPRGGTSMLMQSLIAGGMVPKYTPSEEGIERDRKEGFLSNPVDVYEWVGMPKKLPFNARGRVFKLFPWQIMDLQPGPFKVVMITRGEEGLRASLDRYIEFAGSRPNEKVNPQVLHAREVLDRDDIASIYRGLERVLPALPTVCGVTTVSYEQMCADPHKSFLRLVEDGWPINAAEAAKTVNPNWRQSIDQETVLIA